MLDVMLFRGPLPLELNSSGCVCDSILHKAGMYCFFIMDGLICTAYTNLANTFLISFPSKNSDLSSMLEA